MRRLQVGDLVRFRPLSTMRRGFKVGEDEIGKVVKVEPFPPQTGPTYHVDVEFPQDLVEGVWAFEFELVSDDGPIVA